MGYETRISTKGQVVLPKAVRDALDWSEGRVLEIVEHPGGVTLRPKRESRDDDDVKSREILDRIRARNTYTGPMITLEQMDKGIERAIIEKWSKRLK